MHVSQTLLSARKWLIGGLASLALTSAASAQLTLSIDPPNPGPGDDVEIVLTGGTEGDYTLVLVALDGGPTTFPLVGTLEVGLSALTLYPLGQFDATGGLRFPCALDCFAAEVDPFFMQGLAVRLLSTGPIVSGITNPLVLVIDDNIIQDCNNNGLDDDCDIEEGRSQDCDGNGVPDECQPDCDGDGIPDACDTVIDSYCVTNLADDGCTGTSGRIVWIQEISPREFSIVEGGQLIESDDGTATFSGTIVNVGDPSLRFDMDIVLSGRIDPGDPNHPPAGSPKASAGNCLVDEANYVYYTGVDGVYVGRDAYEGAVYTLTRRGAAAQVGFGANQKNERFGLSSWYDLTQISPPDSGSLPATMEGDFNFDLETGCDCKPDCVGTPAWPTESGTWELSGSLFVFPFGSDGEYAIDCMTATYDGDDLHVAGQASGPDGTVVLQMTFTVFESGSDLQSNDGSNDYGSITHVESNTTLNLRGKVEQNAGYAFRMESTASGLATLEGWFADGSGNLVGDFGPNPAEGVCEDPCD